VASGERDHDDEMTGDRGEAMPEHEHTTVVNVTFQGDEWDYDELVTLGGHDFRLVRVGTSGDARAAEDHVWRWSLEADAIAVSGIREARAAGHLGNSVDDVERIKHTTERVPVRDDSLLADIFQEWAIRRVEAEMPGYFANARVVVVGGTTRDRTIAVLHEFTDNIIFDSPGHDLVLPGQLKTNPITATAAGIGEFAWRHVPDASSRTRSTARSVGSATRSPTSPPRTPTSSSARSPS
jgi:hypothetical protein